MLEEAGFRTGALVALRATGATGPAPSAPGARFVGTVDYEIPVLRQPRDGAETRFGVLSVTFDVYALT